MDPKNRPGRRPDKCYTNLTPKWLQILDRNPECARSLGALKLPPEGFCPARRSAVPPFSRSLSARAAGLWLRLSFGEAKLLVSAKAGQ